MASLIRRAAVVALTALMLGLSGGALATAASAEPSNDGHEWGERHHHGGPPVHFGPFEVPRFGSVSGGFAWNLPH
ncbi:hypothetical protein SNS2_3208 [Streptomyces netropsis]|uniref:Uncharacterized protein n=1 Tax=Streptomyces syringium TaxID=76729 RepID=A0ABS4Y729_9ACTN|nr:hypothetical protein [Streptomyces syringium]SPE57537.1 hypothetical protein SNS2_3208 [Streptomyces netropsis]